MAAMFELPMASEMLSSDELQLITGCSRRNDQIAWLDSVSWNYLRNKAGEPVVGRLYARMRLAGITPSALLANGGWTPDFSSVR